MARRKCRDDDRRGLSADQPRARDLHHVSQSVGEGRSPLASSPQIHRRSRSLQNVPESECGSFVSARSGFVLSRPQPPFPWTSCSGASFDLRRFNLKERCGSGTNMEGLFLLRHAFRMRRLASQRQKKVLVALCCLACFPMSICEIVGAERQSVSQTPFGNSSERNADEKKWIQECNDGRP